GLVVMRAVESNYGEDKSREPTFKPRLKPRGTVMQITSSFFYPPAQHFCIPIIHLRTHAAGIVKKKDVCVFLCACVCVCVLVSGCVVFVFWCVCVCVCVARMYSSSPTTRQQ